MCGVAGILRWDGLPPQKAEIEKMTQALSHRGPDGEGFLVRDGVALGHRRLAIIDLETGQQPMGNEDDTVLITYNGELYNFRELRNDLRQRGHHFRTRSDTEVIIHAYEEWGQACVERFRGMFAFGIADFRNRRLFLARDHFGIKPLYYRLGRDYLAFSSELSALRHVRDETPDGSLQAVDFYLRFAYIPAPHTIYGDVFKLPPASYLTVDFDGGMSGPTEYWHLCFDPVTDGRTDNDWKEDVRETLHESVGAHLVSDVPFGVFLSGGVDSTLVALHMSRILDRPVTAFAIGFDEEEFSELRYAEQAAQRCGVELHTEVVKADSLEMLPDLVAHYGEPFGDSSMIPTWHVARLARRHVPMVLSGDGGDETFGGYNTYARWMESPAYRVARRFCSSPRRAARYVIDAARNRFASGSWNSISEWQEGMLYFKLYMRKALWRAPYHGLMAAECLAFSEADRKSRYFERLAYAQSVDYCTYLHGDILAKVDVASMYHGLEVRTPLIDRQVVQLAAGLPRAQRWRPDGRGQAVRKYVLRSLLEDDFPRQFVHRGKQGFATPAATWFLPGRAGSRLLDEILMDTRSRLYDWFNPDYIRSEVMTHSREHDNSRALWLLLVLGLWLEQNPEIEF